MSCPQGLVRRRSGRSAGLVLLAVGLLLVGCSAGSGAAGGGQPPGPGGPTPVASLPAVGSANPGTSTGTAATTAPPGTRTGSGSAGPTTPESPSPNARDQTRYPTPAGMTPPTATAASAVSCLPLAGGGWQATFAVTLTGGSQWAVVPQHGPATHTGADTWTVVIRQGPGGSTVIGLTRIEVGGGSPYRTATVPLGPGVAVTASCPG